MLKICHVTSVHPRYDIRIFVKECVSLKSITDSVSLIVADGMQDEIKNQINIYDVGKVSGRFKRVTQTSKRIYNKILELQPEVVHFHDPELLWMGFKLSKRGFKVIYDVHEDLPKQVLNKHWIPKLLRGLTSRLVMQMESVCSRKFAGVIAATPIIAKRFLKYNKNSISVCNYPILAELNVAQGDWPSRSNRLCYIGGISRQRGVIPLLDSLSISGLHLDLAGIFSDVTLAQLQQHPNWSYVKYHGVLNRDEIVSLLQTIKLGMVTLLPTPSYIESLPIKLFEYMLAGIPVVASNFELWADIVLKYKCGVLVDPADHNSIAQACVDTLANDKQAQQMAENGRQAVIQHFNWEEESKALIKFYVNL